MASFAEAQDRIDASLDEAAAKQADVAASQFANSTLYTGENAYFAKRGQVALNGRASAETAIDTKIGELREQLTNQRQRRMFDDVVSRRRQDWGREIASYAVGQARVYEREQSSARVYQATQDAVLHADNPEQFAVHLGTVVSEIRQQAASEGLSGEPAQVAEAKAVSDVYASVVQQKAVEDPQNAAAFLDANRSRVNPDTQLALDKMLRPYLDEQGADQIASMIRGTAPVGSMVGATSPLSGNVVDKIIQNESGGNPNAAARESSAKGLGQFTDQTWLGSMKAHGDPNLAAAIVHDGRKWIITDPAKADLIWAARTDPKAGRAMVGAVVEDYKKSLGQAGVPVNDGSIYLAHALGPATAIKFLKAPPDTPVSAHVSSKAINANPTWLKGTTADVVSWANRKMGGTPTIRRVNAAQENDLESQLAAVDALDLPFQRSEAVKRRLISLDGIDRRLKAADEGKAADQAWTIALDPKNTSLRSIPPAVWGRMSVSDQRSVTAALAANAKGVDPAPNPALYLDMSMKAANGTITHDDVRKAWGKVPQGDWEQFATWARSAEQAGADTKNVPVSRIMSVSAAALNASGLSIVGLANKPKELQRREALRYDFVKDIMSDAAAFKANTGKDATDADIAQMVDRRLLRVTPVEGGNEIFQFQASPGQRGNIKIPAADYDRLKDIGAGILGREPTPSQIYQAYITEARGGR